MKKQSYSSLHAKIVALRALINKEQVTALSGYKLRTTRVFAVICDLRRYGVKIQTGKSSEVAGAYAVYKLSGKKGDVEKAVALLQKLELLQKGGAVSLS
jgi:hypothetical protein